MLHATTNTVPISSTRMPLLVGAWLGVGTTLATAGALSAIPQLAPAFVAASVTMFVLVYLRGGTVRRWADALPMRAMIAAHALRLPIGAVFLWEESRGLMDPTFAARAGWGDIAVGAAAMLVALFGSRRRGVVRAFAWFGLVDILIALGTAMYLLFVVNDQVTFDAITRLPYPLLPLVVVPAVITTHLLMLARTRK